MHKKLLALILSLALCAGSAWPVISQAPPNAMVKQRQAAMTLLAKYYGPLAAMADGKAPLNKEVMARNAGYLDALSRMPWDGFAASTAAEKSRVLPAAYSEPAKFRSAQDEFIAAVANLLSLSKGGDGAAVKNAVGTVGETCGGCHKSFRQPS